MKKSNHQSNFDFRLMATEFRLRDWFRPPVKILQEAGLLPGMTVLDFGCGPGSFSLAAARLVGAQGRVYALDIHPLALSMVFRAAAKNGLWNIIPIHATNGDRLINENIDFVLVYDVLHDIQETSSVLTEIHRVLKSNGILAVSDHHLKEAPLLSIVTGGGLFRLAKCNRWTYQFTSSGKSEGAR